MIRFLDAETNEQASSLADQKCDKLQKLSPYLFGETILRQTFVSYPLADCKGDQDT